MESPNDSSFVAEDQWICRSDLIAAAEGFFNDRQKIAAARETEGNIDQRTRDSEPEGNAPAGLFFNIGNICLTRHGRRR
jgi:hypothetical protein